MAQQLRLPWAAALAVALLLSTFVSADSQPPTAPIAEIIYTATGISFEPLVSHDGSTLHIAGHDGFLVTETFGAEDEIVFSIFDAAGDALPDGSFTYELRLRPLLGSVAREALSEARETGDLTVVRRLQAEGSIPREAAMTFGYFTIAGGQIVTDTGPEQPITGRSRGTGAWRPTTAEGSEAESGLESVHDADFLFADDLIVDGSACIGFSCVNGENFGFNTLRLKEHTLRIHFDDTSTIGNYPRTDWRLLLNDATNGGGSYFAVQDVTNHNIPFSLEAKAPESALYIDQKGNLGNRTAVPLTQFHTVYGNTPTLRLEQDNSFGFAPQTWDVAGNETSFFIRDASNGSELPFRIFPGSESDSLVIDKDNAVGMGTLHPQASLHVWGDDGDTALRVEEAQSQEAPRTLLELQNHGRVEIDLEDTSGPASTVTLSSAHGQFRVNADLTAGSEMVLDPLGNLQILGVLTENSNREAKTNIRAVDAEEVLRKVVTLPIASWTYKKEQDVEHLGPMAQDFHAAFGLGDSNLGLTTYDVSGVALAAVQALHRDLERQQALIEAQAERLRQREIELDELRGLRAEILQRLETLEGER